MAPTSTRSPCEHKRRPLAKWTAQCSSKRNGLSVDCQLSISTPSTTHSHTHTLTHTLQAAAADGSSLTSLHWRCGGMERSGFRPSRTAPCLFSTLSSRYTSCWTATSGRRFKRPSRHTRQWHDRHTAPPRPLRPRPRDPTQVTQRRVNIDLCTTGRGTNIQLRALRRVGLWTDVNSLLDLLSPPALTASPPSSCYWAAAARSVVLSLPSCSSSHFAARLVAPHPLRCPLASCWRAGCDARS